MILLSISCSSYSNDNITKLQEIEFDSSEVFPQGGSFVFKMIDVYCKGKAIQIMGTTSTNIFLIIKI